MNVAPSLPAGVRRVAEQPDAGSLHVHPGLTADLPWLVQGVTGRDGDMSLFGGSKTGDVVPRWQQLRDRLGFRVIVHARQVHRDNVHLHDGVLPAGLVIVPDADGHVTYRPGTLLAVSVADCVPISIVAPRSRDGETPAVALLHGGWRGVAAGVLERGLTVLMESYDVDPADLYVHLGPAICGECFEVGPEVPRELGLSRHGADSPVTDPPTMDSRITHVDLRALLAHRAIALGIAPSRVTVSAFCTRHGDSPFYSHRGGCSERQIAVLGIRQAQA